jgi:hypothetical protein
VFFTVQGKTEEELGAVQGLKGRSGVKCMANVEKEEASFPARAPGARQRMLTIFL